MTFTRKDFVILAETMKSNYPRGPAETGYAIAIGAVTAALAKINPAFDTERFIQACMPESE